MQGKVITIKYGSVKKTTEPERKLAATARAAVEALNAGELTSAATAHPLRIDMSGSVD